MCLQREIVTVDHNPRLNTTQADNIISIGGHSLIHIKRPIHKTYANSADPNQTLRNAMSD